MKYFEGLEFNHWIGYGMNNVMSCFFFTCFIVAYRMLYLLLSHDILRCFVFLFFTILMLYDHHVIYRINILYRLLVNVSYFDKDRVFKSCDNVNQTFLKILFSHSKFYDSLMQGYVCTAHIIPGHVGWSSNEMGYIYVIQNIFQKL
jgi:hypothetical protein